MASARCRISSHGHLERADAHAADLRHVAQDRDAELAEQALGHPGHGDARRRLARARALEDVADVAVAVLHGPREVGMPRARPRHRLGRRRPAGGSPTDMVCFQFSQSRFWMVSVMRAAEGQTPADAGGDVGLVPLDLHAPAAAVAALAAGEVLVDVLLGEGQAGRAPVDDGGQRLTVGLAGGEEAERHAARYLLRSAAVGMPARPCQDRGRHEDHQLAAGLEVFASA